MISSLHTTQQKDPCKLIHVDFKSKVKVGSRYVNQRPWMCNLCTKTFLHTPEDERKVRQKVMKYLPLPLSVPDTKGGLKSFDAVVCEECAKQIALAFSE